MTFEEMSDYIGHISDLGADDVVFCTAQTPEIIHICRNCKHYAEYEGVCCYYKSERFADFVGEDYSCKEWSAK